MGVNFARGSGTSWWWCWSWGGCSVLESLLCVCVASHPPTKVTPNLGSSILLADICIMAAGQQPSDTQQLANLTNKHVLGFTAQELLLQQYMDPPPPDARSNKSLLKCVCWPITKNKTELFSAAHAANRSLSCSRDGKTSRSSERELWTCHHPPSCPNLNHPATPHMLPGMLPYPSGGSAGVHPQLSSYDDRHGEERHLSSHLAAL